MFINRGNVNGYEFYAAKNPEQYDPAGFDEDDDSYMAQRLKYITIYLAILLIFSSMKQGCLRHNVQTLRDSDLYVDYFSQAVDWVLYANVLRSQDPSP